MTKNDKSMDVNRLSYEQFREILNEYKRKYGIPNIIYDDGIVSIGAQKILQNSQSKTIGVSCNLGCFRNIKMKDFLSIS